MSTLKLEAEFLRVAQVCDLLGLNRRTVYKLIANNELPASRVGSIYLIQRSDISSMIGAGK